jgi:hypothetical protein
VITLQTLFTLISSANRFLFGKFSFILRDYDFFMMVVALTGDAVRGKRSEQML